MCAVNTHDGGAKSSFIPSLHPVEQEGAAREESNIIGSIFFHCNVYKVALTHPVFFSKS